MTDLERLDILIFYYDEVNSVEEVSRHVLTLIAIIWSALLVSSSKAFATTDTNLTSASVNSTNMTKGIVLDSVGITKHHLEEAIKALQNENKDMATTRLTAAVQGIAQASNEAMLHFEKAIEAFSEGNTSDTLLHLRATIKILK